MALKDEQVAAIMQLINPRTESPYTAVEATQLYLAARKRERKAKGRLTEWDRQTKVSA
jgi:hypothetical protein